MANSIVNILSIPETTPGSNFKFLSVDKDTDITYVVDIDDLKIYTTTTINAEFEQANTFLSQFVGVLSVSGSELVSNNTISCNGSLHFSNTSFTSNTANTGSGDTLPPNPQLYMKIKIGNSWYKIPVYNE